jgi:CheY-like chemotaxis protein
MLEDLGHTAIAAPSGRMALEILRSADSIDLVITDQIMPDMTGAELAKAIRAEWPKLPVILATGFAETPLDSVPLPRLAKPFKQTDLADRIVSVHSQTDRKGRVLRLRHGENSKA